MESRPPSESETRRMLERKLKSLLHAGVTHIPRGRNLKVRESAQAVGDPPPTVAQSKLQAVVSVALDTAAHVASPDLPGPAANVDREQLASSRVAALNALARKVAACTRCAELARTRTQTVFGIGNPLTRLVFMGEAPGAEEDLRGEPFVGAAGQLLTDIITKGMKIRREDVYILNTIKCRPPGNRTPSPEEAANCREFLDGQLAILQPEFICCLGAVASQNLLGTSLPIGQLRGRFHDFGGVKVMCTYHPAYVLRNPSSKRQVWEDIQKLMKEMGLLRETSRPTS